MNLNLQQSAQKETKLVQPEQAMHKQSKLPFVIKTDAINNWLDTIALKQPVQETNEIYTALKILIKHPDQYHQHLNILLPLITPVIIQLSQHLEHLFCSSEKNLDEKKRKIARLSIGTLRYLAILYQNLRADINHPTQHALYFNNCLQISYLCLRQNALIYERPSSELWKIIGKIYQVASEKGILYLKVKDLVATYRKQNCIAENIKAILLFSLCKPYHLKQTEIIRLCYLLDQHNDKLALANQQSKNCLLRWNYNSSLAPQIITPSTDIGFSTLFLDSHLLVPILMSEKFCSIAELLTGNLALVSKLTKITPLRKKISTGFPCVIDIIEQLEQSKKINKTSVQALSITDTFELQPFDYEKTAKSAPTEDTLQHDITPCLIAEATVKEDADLDFMLILLKSFSCNSEDLIITLGDEKSPQLGIIRSITPLKNNHYQLLVEKISSEVNIVTLTNQKIESKALFCKIPDSSTSLLVTTDKYTTGSNVQIAKQSFTLTRLFEITASFMLYQIQAH